MRFSYLNIIRNKLLKTAGTDVSATAGMIMFFLNKLLFKDQDVISNKDGLEYYK